MDHDEALEAGTLTPDHTCGLCCESYNFVMEGVRLSFTSLREHLESRRWRWWGRWLHPLRHQRLLGQLIGAAEVLDDAGK